MNTIIPIKDLKDTAAVSKLCHEADRPVFVTKNGYGDLVIMSIQAYEKALAKLDLYTRLEKGERQIAEGEVVSAEDSMRLTN